MVSITNEAHHLRDPWLLESALAKPRNRFLHGGEEDILSLAISLMAGIVQNHPFEQGNKRTAFLAAQAFLNENGYDLTYRDATPLADLVIGLADHTRTENEVVTALREYVAEFDPPEADHE